MYPVLFHIFGFPVSSFGVMMAVAFLVGTQIAAIQFKERGMDPELANRLMLWAIIGGIAGAKLYYAIDMYLLGLSSFWDSLLSRAGLTFYGGAILGVVFVVVAAHFQKAPLWEVSQCTAVTLAIGQAIGRIGCFLVGDDYGVETNLPWGIAFPKGLPPIDVPVHPTQLYEAFWLFCASWYLWKRRHRSPFLFGEFMILNGTGRFAIESLRRNVRGALGLSEAQWIALGLILVGAIGVYLFHTRKLRSTQIR